MKSQPLKFQKTIPIDYTQQKPTLNKNVDTEAYQKLRKEHAVLNSREASKVTGQGCADIYKNGYPA